MGTSVRYVVKSAVALVIVDICGGGVELPEIIKHQVSNYEHDFISKQS